MLERYARLYAGGLNSDFETLKSKSFYWVASSEIAFYVNKDFDKTFHCLLKAAEFNRENIEWRIVLSKLLLECFKDLLSEESMSLTNFAHLEVHIPDQIYPEVNSHDFDGSLPLLDFERRRTQYHSYEPK